MTAEFLAGFVNVECGLCGCPDPECNTCYANIGEETDFWCNKEEHICRDCKEKAVKE